MDFNILKDRIINFIYLPKELQEPGIVDIIKNSIESGVHQTAVNTWSWLLGSINNSIDGIGLIGVMTTWMLNMMSVPNSGKWCYTIFAVYIVVKILLKCLVG